MLRAPAVANGRREHRTLGDVFNPRSNSLNALRLLLAIAVIVSHSWPIGGYGRDLGWGGHSLGGWAVAGFFAISGYLITGSRLGSRSLIDYSWRRVLRIYPAFVCVLLVTALVFAPLAAIITDAGHYSWKAGIGYVFRNLGLVMIRPRIEDTLATVPHSSTWNGSLWTLAFEFTCYIIVAVIVTIIPRRHVGVAVIVWFVIGTAGTYALMVTGNGAEGGLVRILRLSSFFAAGAILYCYRNKIRFSGVLASASAVAVLATVMTSTFQAFAGLPVAYLMMYLGVVLPLHRVGAKNDISYGMYIYAFPVQQLLAMTIAPVVSVWVFVLVSIVATLPFAWASWLFIERPAMKLKTLTARSAKVTAERAARSSSDDPTAGVSAAGEPSQPQT